MGTGPGSGEDAETYSLNLEVTPEKFMILLTGVGQWAQLAMAMDDPGSFQAAVELSHTILLENRELTREALLNEEISRFSHPSSFDDDLAEELGLKWTGEHWIDAENATQIEIEGGEEGS